MHRYALYLPATGVMLAMTLACTIRPAQMLAAFIQPERILMIL